MIVLPFAVPAEPDRDPEAGVLSRALARELAARLGRAPGVDVVFRPVTHMIDGKRFFGVFGKRWSRDQLERVAADVPGTDLLLNGEARFGDPFSITLEILQIPGMSAVAEETFEAPRYDGLSAVEAATRFVLEKSGRPSDDPAIGDFPARTFDGFLHLIRGREGAAELDLWAAPEDPAVLFAPFLDALDIERDLDAAKEELAILAAGTATAGVVPSDAAEEALNRLLQVDRKCWRGWAALAQVKAVREDLEGAADAFKKALELDPGRASLRFDLGMLLLRQGKTGRAAKTLETVKTDPVHGARALLELGRMQIAKGDPEGAVEILDAAHAADPELPEVYSELGRLFASLGRFDEAEGVFKSGKDRGICTADFHLAYGLYLAEQDRHTESLPELTEVLRLAGNVPVAHLHVGRAHTFGGRRHVALHHLRKALRGDDAVSAAARDAIEEIMPPGQQVALVEALDEATARPAEEQVLHLRELLKEESGFPEAHVRLGIALTATGEFRAAEGSFKKALKRIPDDPEAWSGLATALRARKKYKKALAAHAKALEFAPRHAAYHLNLADTLLRTGQGREAAAEIEVAARLEPTHPLLPNFVSAVKLFLSQGGKSPAE